MSEFVFRIVQSQNSMILWNFHVIRTAWGDVTFLSNYTEDSRNWDLLYSRLVLLNIMNQLVILCECF